MGKKQGQIIIDHGAHPRPHEARTAKSLAAAGYSARTLAPKLRSLRRLVFVNRLGGVIEIK